MKKYVYGIVTIIWIGIIFSFSLQIADESASLSGGVIELILDYLPSDIGEMYDALSEMEKDFFHTIVRKVAHFTEFFVLGMLMILAINETSVRQKQWISIFLCILVASIDETIQLFVPGRAGMIRDVLIDSSGSATGIFIFWLLENLF